MQPILNTFMLHGLPFGQICRIARQAGCAGLSVEASQLEHPELDTLLRQHNLALTGVGAFFLNTDQTDLSALERLLQTASARHVPIVFCVLRPGSGPAEPLCARLERLGQKYGICLCLEPLSPAMGDISPLWGPAQLLSLCRGKDPRWFGWIMDLCHCAGWSLDDPTLEQLAPYLRAIHLADLPSVTPNQNHRLFPGEGELPLFRLFDRLWGLGFDGPVELEVISTSVTAMPEEELTGKIARSFLCTSRCFVAGELAVHHLPDPELTMVGGSAGMVSTQLQALGIQPLLAGLCGADAPGRWLRENARSIAFEVLCQPGRDTSLVRLDPGRPDHADIRPGTVDTTALAAVIREMPDINAWFYLPFFPGYEAAEIAARAKENWKWILDFGYYQWCGDYDVLLAQVKRSAPGFCALINAKEMSRAQKLRLGDACILHGYRYAVLTDRTEPVLLISQQARTAFPVQPAQTPRDTCGAGDCMVAGIMAGLCRGKTMADALAFGIAVSHNKVQTYGIWRDFESWQK